MDDVLGEAGAPEASASGSPNTPRESFATTHWSVVLDACTRDFDKAAAALNRLCGMYWYPIYAFIRRRGSNAHDAEDLTQAFFEHLLERQTLKKVDQNKGKFRSFLLGALTYFLNNEWNKRRTLKRGGQRQIISLDEVAAEGRYVKELAGNLTPEKFFDRQWAALLVEKVLAQLREENQAGGKGALLARLEPLLTQEITPGLYAQLAAEFGVNEGTIKVALHRLRRRFGELLRREVSLTVANAAALDEEVRHLFSALSE